MPRLRRRDQRHRDRGSTGLVTLLALLSVAVAMALVTVTSQAAVATARAQNAADAAALGAILGGPEQAAELSRRNGAQLKAYVAIGNCVEVRVAVGRAQARARAAAGAETPQGYPC